ncbi:expressed unknown protein [Seminavis robusta]|uniref:BACK domain-containing protein n=1 Tax=Seminavis robusta TaxID=568900 RepID=A0A9N8EGF9_9STRA|nr:expressed unknown protein [Seminavis robusta]|eukprot:Sro1161_g247820.1 n/a (440) ;mRNA; r:29305-30624
MEGGQGEEQLKILSSAAKFFTEERLKNFSVVGNDGTRIRVNREWLIARSVLVGALMEESALETSVLRINVPGATFEALYEYLCTGTTQLLRFEKTIGASVEEKDVVEVQSLLSLLVAADYCELSSLSNNVSDGLMRSLEACPSLSLLVLEHCKTDFLTDLAKRAQATLWSNPFRAMDTVAMKHLGEECLDLLLRDEFITADEFEVFRLVQKWVEVNGEAASAPNLIDHVRLENISAKLLSAEVKASQLVSQKDLLEAYEKQALRAQAIHNDVPQGPRYLPNWRHTSTNRAIGHEEEMLDILDCSPMKVGEYRWAFHVQGMSQQPAWIGVALSGKDMDRETSLAKHEYGWAYSSQGGIRHGDRNEQGNPCFKAGSKVTFTLNLSDDNETNGTLSAAIDGGDEFQLFSDLQRELDGPGGFVPAVSLFAPATIEFMGIQRLR